MRRLLLAALILCLSPLPAAALQDITTCQCMEAPLKKRWRDAGAVFKGTVTEVEIRKEWAQRGNDDTPAIVTVTVDEGYKGVEKGNIFKFHSNIHKDTCMGADFALGKTMLFFAYVRKPEVYERWSLYEFESGTYDVGGYCGGTKEMTDPETEPEIASFKDLPQDAELLKPNSAGIIGLPPEKPVATGH